MLSLDSVLCPCCRAPVCIESGNRETKCLACGNELLVSSTDPSYHFRSEIDSSFSGGAFGAIRLVIHPRGTIVCPQCATVYPANVECCPELIKFAVNWYYESDDRHSASSRSVILHFVRDRPESAKLFTALQVIESEIDDECDIPMQTLRKFAVDVGDWLTKHMDKFAR